MKKLPSTRRLAPTSGTENYEVDRRIFPLLFCGCLGNQAQKSCFQMIGRNTSTGSDNCHFICRHFIQHAGQSHKSWLVRRTNLGMKELGQSIYCWLTA